MQKSEEHQNCINNWTRSYGYEKKEVKLVQVQSL